MGKVKEKTPLLLVQKWSKQYPEAYKIIESYNDLNGVDGYAWPDYCAMPIGIPMGYLLNQNMPSNLATVLASELTACYIWRLQKVIYSFDPDLAEALMNQAEDMNDTDVLPVDLLYHLPYPCVYITAEAFHGAGMDGFWAWIEYDVNTKSPELRVQWVTKDCDQSIPAVLHLIRGGTIRDCIQDTRRRMSRRAGSVVRLDMDDYADFFRALQLLLYLISDDADVTDDGQDLAKTHDGDTEEKDEPTEEKPKTKTIKDKYREIQKKNVGIYIGAALRKGKQGSAEHTGEKTGRRVRTHLRRGHWHHYWYGPMIGPRKLRLKWTAPTTIHPDSKNEDIVIVPVK